MKKALLALFVLSTSAYAASDLVKDFTARRAIVHTTTRKGVYNFLKFMEKNPENLKELELLNDQGKFAARFIDNDEVCFGDTQTASLNCYNATGLQTFFEAGDTD